MLKRLTHVVLLLIAHISSCVATDGVRAQSTPKTLFAWSVGEREPSEGEEEDPRLVTDRPHFSEASSLVGLGVVQVEMGYSLFRDESPGSVIQTQSFPEPLLRMGLFAEWFEFRLGYNYLVQRATRPISDPTTLSGSDDLYVAAKLALAEQVAFLPEVALFPQMRVPTGGRDFTSGQVMPGFNLAYSWKINQLIELECNTQLNRRVDDTNHFYSEFIQTANIEYDISKRLGAFTEWLCFVPNGAVSAQTQHYFHGGFVYFVTPNIQLDLHSAVGLSEASSDLAFTGGGLSIRF